MGNWTYFPTKLAFLAYSIAISAQAASPGNPIANSRARG